MEIWEDMSSGLTGRYSASLSDITSFKGTKSPQREAQTNDREEKDRKRPESFQSEGSKWYCIAHYTLQITFLAIVWFQTIISMRQAGQIPSVE